MPWPPSVVRPLCCLILYRTQAIGLNEPVWQEELDLAQDEGERHGAKRDQRQKPESVHVGGERCLRLDLLSDPLSGLLLRLENRAAMGEEIVRHLLQRVLIRRV